MELGLETDPNRTARRNWCAILGQPDSINADPDDKRQNDPFLGFEVNEDGAYIPVQENCPTAGQNLLARMAAIEAELDAQAAMLEANLEIAGRGALGDV